MANITKVYLLDTPLDKNYEHTLYFKNADEQSAYFSSKVKFYFDDFSYQRKDHIIRVNKQVDELLGCNYVMYQNKAYTNKWFYAFITKMEYINDDRTDIYIETDVLQTWLEEYTVNASFVEREHVAVDNTGEYTYLENVEMGSMVVNAHEELGANDLSDLRYVIASTYNPSTQDDEAGVLVNGIYSGVKYFTYPTATSVNAALSIIVNNGKTDAVTSVFMCPSSYVGGDVVGEITANSLGPVTKDYYVSKQTTLDGYTPRNKKLLCYPFNYLLISNSGGGNAIFRYEEFSEDSCTFTNYGVITPGVSMRLIPTKYKKCTFNYDEGLTGAKYPICNFATDSYTNWLTYNSVNQKYDLLDSAVSIAGSVVGGTVGGFMAGGPVGAITGGVGGLITGGYTGGMQIARTLEQKRLASLVPDQAKGNLNSGDVTTAMGCNCYQVYKMSIKKEYAQMIDGYFDMYGYQVNTLKVPNKNHRYSWWYTKTISANITGAIPCEDLSKIKECYNNGITFWRTPATMLDYSQDNTTITWSE